MGKKQANKRGVGLANGGRKVRGREREKWILEHPPLGSQLPQPAAARGCNESTTNESHTNGAQQTVTGQGQGLQPLDRGWRGRGPSLFSSPDLANNRSRGQGTNCNGIDYCSGQGGRGETSTQRVQG